MQGDDGHGSPLAPRHPRLRHATTTLPYCSSSAIPTCSSTSVSSVWSSASCDSSQSSIDDATFDCLSAVSSQTSVSSVGSVCLSQLGQSGSDAKLAAARTWQSQQQQLQQLQQFHQLQQIQLLQQQQQQQQQRQPASSGAVPAQLRQHPRRSSVTSAGVPSLVRQSDRRSTFVDHLVDASTQIVQAIWPLSSVIARGEACSSSSSNGSYLLPLRTFIQETLRRSRASYSTLQVALYYLLLIKPRLPSHSFTMEQSSESLACRALQCGRRMFLAALILASKYLQDRNYSARAWSKISGLSTAEINQNEAAFLHAVNWRLHITNEVYHRWIECVNKFNSPQLPPSPGPAVVDGFERKCFEFRMLIQKLSPSLDNLEELCGPSLPAVVRRSSSSCQLLAGALSPVSMCSSPEAAADSPLSSSSLSSDNTPLASSKLGGGGGGGGGGSGSSGAAPMSGVMANAMLHSPATPTAFTPSRLAPSLNLLPTPKLAPPQAGIFNCGPAAGSAMPMLPGGRSSMCFAVAQASSACSNQFLDRWPPALAMASSSMSSPAGCVLTRRSSLANSVSTASSPESMVSDSSLISRSSSVSSAWSSLMNAPSVPLSKLDAQARHRFAPKQQCAGGGGGLRDKSCFGLRPTVIPAVVPEDYETGSTGYASSVFASPETTAYTGPFGKDVAVSMGTGAASCRSSAMNETDAARALAELQQQQYCGARTACTAQAADLGRPRAGLKRSRPMSLEATSLQDNVRDLLRGGVPPKMPTAASCGLEAMVRGQAVALPQPAMTVAPSDLDMGAASRAATLTGSRKRLCRTTSAGTLPTAPAFSYGMDLQHPSMGGLCGPGMWQGILN